MLGIAMTLVVFLIVIVQAALIFQGIFNYESYAVKLQYGDHMFQYTFHAFAEMIDANIKVFQKKELSPTFNESENLCGGYQCSVFLESNFDSYLNCSKEFYQSQGVNIYTYSFPVQVPDNGLKLDSLQTFKLNCTCIDQDFCFSNYTFEGKYIV